MGIFLILKTVFPDYINGRMGGEVALPHQKFKK